MRGYEFRTWDIEWSCKRDRIELYYQFLCRIVNRVKKSDNDEKTHIERIVAKVNHYIKFINKCLYGAVVYSRCITMLVSNYNTNDFIYDFFATKSRCLEWLIDLEYYNKTVTIQRNCNLHTWIDSIFDELFEYIIHSAVKVSLWFYSILFSFGLKY